MAACSKRAVGLLRRAGAAGRRRCRPACRRRRCRSRCMACACRATAWRRSARACLVDDLELSRTTVAPGAASCRSSTTPAGRSATSPGSRRRPGAEYPAQGGAAARAGAAPGRGGRARSARAMPCARRAGLERALLAAKAADRSKTEFLSNVSHELRTPMNGILGVAQLLQTTRLDDEQRELVAVLFASANAQMALISDLLDFSRMEGGNRQAGRRAVRAGRGAAGRGGDDAGRGRQEGDHARLLLGAAGGADGDRRPARLPPDRHQPGRQRRQVHRRAAG